MMEEIHLWAMESSSGDELSAIRIDAIKALDAEQMLEDLLTKHPELLLPDLTLVGRQTPAAAGWLDLLGVDGDGKLVVFELKRGTLARDAVAQVIDYASYLDSLDEETLARHISDRSGKYGIEKIEDFQEWYQQTFPGQHFSSVLPPRMVLVGLGVDEPTERMTRFLADSGTDISLLTFHGFRHNGQTLLARQVRIKGQDRHEGSTVVLGRQAREEAILELAKQLGVSRRVDDVRSLVKEKFPSAIENIGKESVSYSLLARAESGNPSYRVYANLYLNRQNPGRLDFHFYERAVELASEQFKKLEEDFPHEKTNWTEIVFPLTSDTQWSQLKEKLSPILSDVYEAWQNKAQM